MCLVRCRSRAVRPRIALNFDEHAALVLSDTRGWSSHNFAGSRLNRTTTPIHHVSADLNCRARRRRVPSRIIRSTHRHLRRTYLQRTGDCPKLQGDGKLTMMNFDAIETQRYNHRIGIRPPVEQFPPGLWCDGVSRPFSPRAHPAPPGQRLTAQTCSFANRSMSGESPG